LSERTFSDEVRRRLDRLEAAKVEAVFRAAWGRMAPALGVSEPLPASAQARMLWRMAFAKALAEIADPHFEPRSIAGKNKQERAACVAAHKTAPLGGTKRAAVLVELGGATGKLTGQVAQVRSAFAARSTPADKAAAEYLQKVERGLTSLKEWTTKNAWQPEKT
jgi:hypothetical protein